MYFLCSEALTNVTKYARAGSVSITIHRSDDHVRAIIEDGGRGGADPRLGSGLRGLADRLEALGGQLRVESPLGAGTQLTATLPIDGGRDVTTDL